MTKRKLREAASLVKESDSFVVAGHVNPDGDCLGCICALGLALSRLGKTVVTVSSDGVPELYGFLPGSENVLRQVPENRAFDVAIVIDCENFDRLGPMAEILPSCGRILEIDHHPGGERGSGLQLVDPSAASCGEIMFELFEEGGIGIDSEVAECLLTAIVTDTGCFKFGNVTPSTLRIAARLLESEGSIEKISHEVYETRSLSSAKLLGAALSTLRTTANGRIAYACITRDQMASAGAAEAETEGIVNYVRSVRGAEVGILFREAEDGATRISLRSREGLDVNEIARQFKGGGHKAAAGCTIERPLTEAIELLMNATRQCMGY